jgi:hypothetical protein
MKVSLRAQQLRGQIIGNPAVILLELDGTILPSRNKEGRLDVFVRFTDVALWHIVQSSLGAWNLQPGRRGPLPHGCGS